MDVVILSTYDADGSGIFAIRLLQTLQKIGYKAQIVCVESSAANSNVKGIFDKKPLQGILYSIKTRMSRVLYGANPEYAFIETNSISAKEIFSNGVWPPKCNMIICTFLSGMFSADSLCQIRSRYGNPPVIFYGVDMNFYTGGCHYSRDCLNYVSECSNCPAVNPVVRPLVRKSFSQKNDFVRGLTNHVVIASSNEHYKQLCKSMIFSNSEIKLILMPVDNELYGSGEQTRSALKLEYGFSGRTILVRSSAEPRKGSKIFVECMRLLILSTPELVNNMDIIAIGDQYIANELKPLGIKIYSPGYVSSENELSRLYTLSDMFINTSLADGGPMMIAESLMSYTPVITTDVGLARDLVLSDFNGTILEEATPSVLASSLRKYCAWTDAELDKMRLNAREGAMNLLQRNAYTEKISNLIKSIMGY